MKVRGLEGGGFYNNCSLTGVFIARGKEDVLVTRNLVAGESVYGEKRISVDVSSGRFQSHDCPPIT